MDLALPTVHLNGTSRERLLEGYQEAYEKLVEFRDALRGIEFNARDYYVKPGSWEKACQERDNVRESVGKVQAYLEAHLLHLLPQD